MKNLHFDYCMEIFYTIDVVRCCYTIKCIPKDSDRQKISNIKIEMIPESKPEWGSDAHGNRYIYGCNEAPHAYFKYRITGDAQCGLADYECLLGENDEMLYRHGGRLTRAGAGIKAYYEKLIAAIGAYEELGPYEKAQEMMKALYRDYTYQQNCTFVDTTAEEAFLLGKGVCQDYAHIFISVLRLAGIPARYVTGLMLGEGASHAWVEVADQGKWYGLDPTNNQLVGEDYVKIGVGRDASECQLNRGIMHGGGNQTQEIRVSVSEASKGEQILRKGAFFHD